jgi:uncharacterized transporter YbjL
MPELSALGIVGWGAVAVVIVATLVTALLGVGPARVRAASVAATSLYVALCSLFLHLFLRAREGDSTAGMFGFGFLLVLFVAGLGISLAKLAGAFRAAPAKGASHATH